MSRDRIPFERRDSSGSAGCLFALALLIVFWGGVAWFLVAHWAG